MSDVTLLGLTAAARRLSLAIGTVRGYADSGRLPSIRDSAGRRLFFVGDVENLARQRKAKKVKP
jgi:predicted site-specific integrase-resolvase